MIRQLRSLGYRIEPPNPQPSCRMKSGLATFDGMIKRRNIRALVVYSKSCFFYDQGRPEGIFYEAAHPTGGFYVKRDFILAEQCTARSELLTDV